MDSKSNSSTSNGRDFLAMNLGELRQELRKRNAKTSGRKAELVERLQSYTRNDNFGQSPVNEEIQYVMELPPKDNYKDVNSDSKLPKVLEETLTSYLSQTTLKQAAELFTEQHILFIRHHDTYVHAQVKSTHKKGMKYYVDLNITWTGTVCDAQCECAVGMGPQAKCKHIAVALYAVLQHSLNKPVITSQSCTQKLQTFHTSKPHTGSPLKCCDLKLKLKETSNSSAFSNILADPRPAEGQMRENYPAFFRNLWLSAPGSNQRPITQLYGAANMRGIGNDHDYCELTLEERFLAAHRLNFIIPEEIQAIEASTRIQNGSKEWSEQRLLRLTASNFGRICKSNEKNKVSQDLLQPKDLEKVPAIKYGRQTEPIAAKAAEDQLGVSLDKCGLFVMEKAPFLAASPDRLAIIDNQTFVVEIKCPFSAKDKEVNDKTVPYLTTTDDLLELKATHDYYYQVQGQMMCTGLHNCLFIVYTGVECKILRVKRDDTFIDTLLQTLNQFYEHIFMPKILSRYLYKDE